ncbi:MAG TPA: alpha/beta hydrolase [Syntrophales bacterium]|nr:alpha/beta hydrolase [Syntrophales bacterium]HOL59160.1 alpha/beta hydrolase [Syntrophales bacterium]HPO35759.1 alpha/beta hydrolase [Syntrophales bacterium]
MNTAKVSVERGLFNYRFGGNEAGFPVVALHGWPESSFCWEGVARHLDSRFRLIAPDLRGLGDSERTLDPSLYLKEALARDMVEVIDALGIGDFFLVGHDWGGIVAQEVAIACPERVKKLVIMNIPVITNARGNREAREVINSWGGLPHWYQYFQQQPGLAEAMIKGNEEVWVSYFFGRAGREGRIPREAIDEYVRCYKIEHTPQTAAFYYRAMRHDYARWEMLAGKKFPMPTLYIYGEKDVVIIPQYLNHLEEVFNSIQVVRFEASHFVQEEEPEKVAAAMNAFFLS